MVAALVMLHNDHRESAIRRCRRSGEHLAAVPNPLHHPAAALLAFSLQRVGTSHRAPEQPAEPGHQLRPAFIAEASPLVGGALVLLFLACCLVVRMSG
jgi:hypothetical protein